MCLCSTATGPWGLGVPPSSPTTPPGRWPSFTPIPTESHHQPYKSTGASSRWCHRIPRSPSHASYNRHCVMEVNAAPLSGLQVCLTCVAPLQVHTKHGRTRCSGTALSLASRSAVLRLCSCCVLNAKYKEYGKTYKFL